MITVTIYGLDQFVVGRLSREMTPNLAKLYELSEDEILFVAPQNMVFHKGVEQTSWNVLIHVNAPKKADNRYCKFNESYPRFIDSDNLVDIAEEDYEDMEEGEGEDEIFTGDIFQNFHD